MRKIRTSFKTPISKEATIWRLNESRSNDKLLPKIMSSSYHMELKILIEASCIYNMHTGEKDFCSYYFRRFVSRFDSNRVTKLEMYFGLYESSLL